MSTARTLHAASLLPNGKAVVAGGIGLSSFLVSSELFDPASGSWTNTGSLGTARREHTATLLPNGRVLVTGGFGSAGSSGYQAGSEVYDPATGVWTGSGVMHTARDRHASTLLPTGKVLVAGGEDSSFGPTSSAELFDVGLGFSASWQPQIATATSPLSLGSGLALTGSRFRGISGGSCGNSGDSPADYPVVQLRSLQTEQFVFVSPTSFSSNSFASAAVSGLTPGHALVTVFANGIPSSASIVRLDIPPIILTGATKLPNGPFQFSFANLPGFSFTALGATNLSLLPANWTVLGSPTEISPGQFQFTDTQATNIPQRFYEVRSP
jgi:hypothetical protein